MDEGGWGAARRAVRSPGEGRGGASVSKKFVGMYCIHAPSDVASLACELIENGLIGVGDIVVLPELDLCIP